MTKRQAWRAGFLAVIGLAVGMELWAFLDEAPDTEPLTQIVVEHVPAPIAMGFIVSGSGWLVWHFIDAYRKREGNRS